MKYFLKTLIIVFVSCIILCSHAVYAGEINVSANKHAVAEGELFEVTFVLNTEGESINAIEGDIVFDGDLVKPEIVNTAGSFINFWVEEPKVNTEGIMHFSGITPGGVSATRAEFLKVIFRASKIGTPVITLRNIKLLINDGEGTMSGSTVAGTTVSISKRAVGASDPAIIIEDTVPPEVFAIERSRNTQIFDNKWFVVFGTADKNSGIRSYEVCEIWSCVEAKSPYKLRNQTPFFLIDVKAYDNNGNETAVRMVSPYLVALMLVIVIIFSILILKFRKKT